MSYHHSWPAPSTIKTIKRNVNLPVSSAASSLRNDFLQTLLGVFFAIRRGGCELVPSLEHVEVKLEFVSKLSRLVNINWTTGFIPLLFT